MSGTTIKYRDDLGCDINGCGRLVMEKSSISITKEDVKHTQGDTIKALCTSIELLFIRMMPHRCIIFHSLPYCIIFTAMCMHYHHSICREHRIQ